MLLCHIALNWCYNDAMNKDKNRKNYSLNKDTLQAVEDFRMSLGGVMSESAAAEMLIKLGKKLIEDEGFEALKKLSKSE